MKMNHYIKFITVLHALLMNKCIKCNKNEHYKLTNQHIYKTNITEKQLNCMCSPHISTPTIIKNY